MVSIYLRIHYNNSTSIQSVRFIKLGDTGTQRKSMEDSWQLQFETMGMQMKE